MTSFRRDEHNATRKKPQEIERCSINQFPRLDHASRPLVGINERAPFTVAEWSAENCGEAANDAVVELRKG